MEQWNTWYTPAFAIKDVRRVTSRLVISRGLVETKLDNGISQGNPDVKTMIQRLVSGQKLVRKVRSTLFM